MSRSRLLAGLLTGAWVAWWTFFAAASATQGGGTLAQFLPVAAGLAAILYLVPFLAWRLRPRGGILLVVEGLCLLVWVLSLNRNTALTTALLAGTLALPPILAGLLLLAGPTAAHGTETGRRDIEPDSTAHLCK